MFLLNLFVYVKTSDSTITFTSHYVPIKSCSHICLPADLLNFTSHYVPIKSVCRMVKVVRIVPTLHPIMFLLNLPLSLKSRLTVRSLHPIMFLLNPERPKKIAVFSPFTSHYVPIKSGGFPHDVKTLENLYIPLCSY